MSAKPGLSKLTDVPADAPNSARRFFGVFRYSKRALELVWATSPKLALFLGFVTLLAAEFFINSERAFIEVYRALQHAREKNRHDSIALYTRQLTTLVEATSYSEVIEQIRREELAE